MNHKSLFSKYICHSSMFGMILSSLVSQQVWHLITGRSLCVASIPTSDIARDLSQYEPGCSMEHNTPTLTLSMSWLL